MNMQKSQRIMIGGIIAAVLVVGVIGFGAYSLTRTKSNSVAESPKPEEKKKKRVDTYNTLAIDERPYIEIQPKGTGHDVAISINQLKKAAESVDYELEYQSGELLQGAFGNMTLSSLPAVKEILLGTRSAGGATTYHENVKGGTLVTRFTGTNAYSLKSDWRFIENRTRAKAISSKDVKFQIESADIAKQPVVIISNSPGYPGTLPGTAVSDTYVVSFPSSLTGKAKVTFQVKDAVTSPEIALWEGQNWKTVAAKNETIKTTMSGGDAGYNPPGSPTPIEIKQVTADVDLAKIYVLITK